MPINTWWSDDPRERFWIEVTDRPDLGADLKAPQANENGAPYWGYSLVEHVSEGDVVYHYDKRRAVPGIVAVSVATGDHWEDSIVWAARGTSAREADVDPYAKPGFYAGLKGFRKLGAPVTLEEVRGQTAAIQAGLRDLNDRHQGALYFPFALSTKRPLRTSQGYLFKLPRFVVDLFSDLDLYPSTDNDRIKLETASPEGPGSEYRRPDEKTTIGTADPFSVDPSVVERGTRAHAVTQNILADAVSGAGLDPLSPSSNDSPFDLAWHDSSVLHIAEVKSLTPENEEKQLRLGLGQLLRYAHLLSAAHPEVRPILFIEREPNDPTWIDLCRSVGVVLASPTTLQRVGLADK